PEAAREGVGLEAAGAAATAGFAGEEPGSDEPEDGGALAGGRALADGRALGEDGRSAGAGVRSSRGPTTSATRKVAAAPTTKYLREPSALRGAGARRGAPMVTLTLGSEVTGMREGAAGCAGGTCETGPDTG